jgi:ABC-type glutathione transport system ATPase component
MESGVAMSHARNPAMSQSLLRVRLSAGFGKTTVLDGVEIELWPGECLGVVGTSGAGKSTLVLALLGLLPWRGGWTRGEVVLQGRDLLRLNEREARRIRGKEIALVPQSPMSALNPATSLRSQFRQAWLAHEKDAKGMDARMHDLLRRMQLPWDDAFLKRKPGEISVGQAQRITLAMALLHRPALLIADEPTSALDPSTQVEVLRLLRDIQREEGVALLYISHDLISVLQLCDCVSVLDRGRIVTRTPVDALCDAQEVATHPELQTLLRTLPVPVEAVLAHARREAGQGSIREVTLLTRTGD